MIWISLERFGKWLGWIVKVCKTSFNSIRYGWFQVVYIYFEGHRGLMVSYSISLWHSWYWGKSPENCTERYVWHQKMILFILLIRQKNFFHNFSIPHPIDKNHMHQAPRYFFSCRNFFKFHVCHTVTKK